MMLEELNGSFVLLGFLTRDERPKVPALAGLRVLLPRVEPILGRFQFADHGRLRRGAGTAPLVRIKKNWLQSACRRGARTCPPSAIPWARSACRTTSTTGHRLNGHGRTSRSAA